VKWWVIVNPAAGNKTDLTERAATALAGQGVDFEMRVSSSPEDVAVLVSRGREAGVTRFAGVGGDGTAHLIVNGLMRHEWERPPGLAILPAGSGSDFIRTFGLPRTIEAMAPHLATDDWYRCDVLRVEGDFGTRYALNVVEAGVGAAAVSTAALFPRWVGGRRYAIAFWLTLPRFTPGLVAASVDGKEAAGPAIAAIVANGQYFGGGMNIAPRAAVGDETAEIQIFRGPRRKALTVMPRVVRGMHLTHRNVRRLTGRSITVEVPADWPVEADGEAIGLGSIAVTVVAAAIEFKI
jgi:diacylglycerol kinase (ATP)